MFCQLALRRSLIGDGCPSALTDFWTINKNKEIKENASGTLSKKILIRLFLLPFPEVLHETSTEMSPNEGGPLRVLDWTCSEISSNKGGHLL